MAIDVLDEAGDVITLKLHGTMKKAEHDKLLADTGVGIGRVGKIKLLVILEDFQGWERGVDWSDISFQVEHGDEIEKMAIVGDEKWKDLMFAFVGKPFRSTAIEYFASSRLEQARAWLA